MKTIGYSVLKIKIMMGLLRDISVAGNVIKSLSCDEKVIEQFKYGHSRPIVIKGRTITEVSDMFEAIDMAEIVNILTSIFLVMKYRELDREGYCGLFSFKEPQVIEDLLDILVHGGICGFEFSEGEDKLKLLEKNTDEEDLDNQIAYLNSVRNRYDEIVENFLNISVDGR
jgi:hypothetical protein